MSENPLTPLSQGSVGVIRRILGPAATELGEMLADRVKQYRSNNIRRVIEKTGNQIQEQDVLELPLRFSIPLLEKASLEDDEMLSNMWSNLLADAAKEIDDQHYLISKILADLTPNAALLLESLVEDFFKDEDWYGKLDWENQWLQDFEKFVETKQDELHHQHGKQDTEVKREQIALEIAEFSHELPIWAFQFSLPLIMEDIVEGIDGGRTIDDFGQVTSSHSFEHASLQILEREQLVVRRKGEFKMKYCRFEFSYVVVTALGVALVQMCMSDTLQIKEAL